MTIQERLRRSNLVMLVVPVVIAGVLFAAGLSALALLLNAVYLPRLGLTFQDLHSMGEEMEQVFRGLKLFVVLYAAVVLAALLAAVAFTNLYLTRALFAHIQKPLNILLQGVQRIQNGDLETPICYQEADEFRPACDAVDAMAVQLRDSLQQQQREQQKKQELIAGMSHDLKSPLTTIRAYTEALLEGVAPDEAARQRYLQTIYTRETDLEALVNRLFELAKLGGREYPARLQPLPLRETLQAILKDADHEGVSVDCDAVADCTVTVDRELLSRILHNLMDNSCKYGADALTFGARTDGLGGLNYAQLQPLQLIYLFCSGAVAITAMVLPGISGSSILLIAGVYLPTIQAVHSLLRFQLAVFPGLCALGLGVLMGIAVSIHAIRAALQRSRSAMVWLILGLMLGSLYAIVNGPASLDTPLPALRLATFQLPAFLLGATLLLALEGMKKAMEKTAGKH